MYAWPRGASVVIVDSVMSRDPVTCGEEAVVRQAARLMRKHRIGCLIVTREGRATGMFTESDLTRSVAEGVDLDNVQIGVCMSKPLVSIEATAGLSKAAEVMRAKKVRRLAVVVDDEVRGVVTVRDLAFAMPASERGELDALRFRWQD